MCNIIITEGTLLLEPDFGVFELQYNTRNSCDQTILSRIDDEGLYDQNGNALAFVIPAVVPSEEDLEFSGEVREQEIVDVQFFDDLLTFK